MVKEINSYAERKVKEERKEKKFKDWVTIVSEIFQKPLYRIEKQSGCLYPSICIYFEMPNEYFSTNDALLQKTDSTTNRELYSSLVDKCNTFNGFHHAVNIHPWSDSIDAMCPEVYPDARRVAVKLEKRLGREVSLEIEYPLGEQKEKDKSGNTIYKIDNGFYSRLRGFFMRFSK